MNHQKVSEILEAQRKQLREYKSRIADLEKKVKEYYAEKRDDKYRKDMEPDGKIDEQEISKAMAKQIQISYKQTWDKDNLKDVMSQKKQGKTSKLTKRFDEETEEYQQTIAKFGELA